MPVGVPSDAPQAWPAQAAGCALHAKDTGSHVWPPGQDPLHLPVQPSASPQALKVQSGTHWHSLVTGSQAWPAAQVPAHFVPQPSSSPQALPAQDPAQAAQIPVPGLQALPSGHAQVPPQPSSIPHRSPYESLQLGSQVAEQAGTPATQRQYGSGVLQACTTSVCRPHASNVQIAFMGGSAAGKAGGRGIPGGAARQQASWTVPVQGPHVVVWGMQAFPSPHPHLVPVPQPSSPQYPSGQVGVQTQPSIFSYVQPVVS